MLIPAVKGLFGSLRRHVGEVLENVGEVNVSLINSFERRSLEVCWKVLVMFLLGE